MRYIGRLLYGFSAEAEEISYSIVNPLRQAFKNKREKKQDKDETEYKGRPAIVGRPLYKSVNR